MTMIEEVADSLPLHSEVVLPTVMFVDDEPPILASLRSLLRREKYNFCFFESAQRALEYLERHTADVIVSDLRMPEMTGVEFLNLAGGLRPGASRIMLSGYEDKAVVISAIAKGLAQYYVMKPWDDGSLKTLLAEALQLQRQQGIRKLQATINSLTALPSPPRFHERLQSMLSDADNSMGEIVVEIEKSPALVAKLLRVANSVYYGSRRSVSTIREAVTFIGTEYVASLVMGIEAFQSLCPSTDPVVATLVEELWSRALFRATIAKFIAEHWEGLKDPQKVYVTSLLQDIGYAVRLCYFKEDYLMYVDACKSGDVPRREVEARFFPVLHDEVGSALLEYWNLPRDLVRAVAMHHASNTENPLIHILQIADILEGSEPSTPHDPVVDPLVDEWRQKAASLFPQP